MWVALKRAFGVNDTPVCNEGITWPSRLFRFSWEAAQLGCWAELHPER
uniref:Uncharacterized protein n=1 Tax=Anguilla anguilla TaxID=7936 RepID=A0A0E9SPR4_ANGAN